MVFTHSPADRHRRHRAVSEIITIIEGRATCDVEGRRYELGNCDTAFVPRGLGHHFENRTHQPLAMIWIYAGPEPKRKLIDAS